MTRYVALLRGINVGTAKPIAMTDLRECIEALGFTGVRTLLRSGNVVFDAPGAVETDAVDAGSLETAIAEATGVSASVVLVDDARFRRIVAGNPLASVASDPSRALVYFLDSTADDTGLGRPADTDLLPERLAFGPNAIYQWCPNGISQSRVPLKFFTTLGVTATGRNLRTVEKIVALLDAP